MTRCSTRWRVWLVVGVVVSSAGCTLGLAYNYADWLALWRIDHYVDLTERQKAFLAEQLKSILARHRKEALPKYELVLNRLQEKFRNRLTRGDVDWFFTTYGELRADLFELFVEDGTRFLASVDDRQARYLEEAVREDNDKIEARLQDEPGERLIKRAASTVDWLEDWLGPLTSEQEQRIRQMSISLPDTLEPWIQYRRYRQQAFLELLRASRPGETISERLRVWLVFPERDAPAGYLRSREEMRRGITEIALSIDGMMTSRQRSHLLLELQEVIDALRDLSTA